MVAISWAVGQLWLLSGTAHAAEPELEELLDTIPVASPSKGESEPAATPIKERSRPLIEEVVVTAQRREERAQDVPISITVFSPEQLSNANITTAADLVVYTPSLAANNRFGSDNATFAIRGFTQDLRTTASVGVYFAEVVAPRGQSAQSSGDGAGPGTLFDLQSVQVLKGPQGTLFGRNSTGGAVLIVPQKPTDEFGGYAELSGGEFNGRQAQAVLNVPVTDELKLRFGVDSKQRDGYLNNVARIGADDFENTDYTALRLSAVWNLTDTLENYTIVSGVNSMTHGATAKVFACNPDLNPLNGNAFGVLVYQPCIAELAAQPGYYDLHSTISDPQTELKERRAINTTTWTINDNLTFKNTIAYSHLFTLNSSDIFGTNFHVITDPNPAREFKVAVSLVTPGVPTTSQRTWVEEVQLQGGSFDSRLEWQTGAYYEHSMPDGVSGQTSPSLLSCNLESLAGDPSQYNCFDITGTQLGGVLNSEYKTDYLNQAVYAQSTLHVSDQFDVTAGLRYTWDRTKGEATRTRYTFVGTVRQPPSVSILTPEVRTDAPTGVFEVSYKPIDDVMGYAKYVRGYRQGSIVLAADSGIDTFEAERVDTYELGAKTSFDGFVSGRFNFALFYNELTNQQLQVGYISPDAGNTTAIFNAGKSRIAGAELEAFFSLTERLSLSLSGSHLRTKLLSQSDNSAAITNAAGPLAGAVQVPIADVGDSLPFAADYSGVATLAYTFPLPSDNGEVDLGVTYVYTGTQRVAASSATPFDELEPFELLNLNLNWSSVSGLPLDLALFATNVLDEEYATYNGGVYKALGFEVRTMGQPRMLGARLKYRFGG
ncbi:MAG TPA: TonB-dependent receptor [Solimonas sp.]|nr:TonB-dependent receptor [Solimonas sp.]